MEHIEKRLLAIWQGIIHAETINTQESFLDQGGNSLHFIKLASVASKELNLSISPSDIFTAGNISSLATMVRKKLDK